VSSFDIAISRNGQCTAITIDGHDITKAARGVTIHSQVNQIATIVVDMPVIETTRVSGEAKLIIDPAVRETLIRWGWTPPADAD
jgi:hypothetical protein